MINISGKFFVTGASGFIGSRLCDFIPADKLVVLGRSSPESQCVFFKKNIDSNSCYKEALTGVEVVFHLAAKVHAMKEIAGDDDYNEINFLGAVNLAKQAAKAGVKRFIFLSSIKVNGEYTTNRPFVESDVNSKTFDPYGLSKLKAEKAILEVGKESNMDVVIIRPPLVYGPNVKGNFSVMIKFSLIGFPLPFSLVKNRRSLVALDNLVDCLLFCADYKRTPNAANQIFLISDGKDLSTAELIRCICKAYGKKDRLIPIPIFLMRFFLCLIAKKNVADRLFDSLQVDSSKLRDYLGWQPIITIDEQLKKMAEIK